MGTPPSRLSLSLASVSRFALTVGIGILGVVMAHYPMIFSGFERIQTDLGDTRLIHYLLERGYLWVRRVPEQRIGMDQSALDGPETRPNPLLRRLR